MSYILAGQQYHKDKDLWDKAGYFWREQVKIAGKTNAKPNKRIAAQFLFINMVYLGRWKMFERLALGGMSFFHHWEFGNHVKVKSRDEAVGLFVPRPNVTTKGTNGIEDPVAGVVLAFENIYTKFLSILNAMIDANERKNKAVEDMLFKKAVETFFGAFEEPYCYDFLGHPKNKVVFNRFSIIVFEILETAYKYGEEKQIVE